MMQTCYKGNTDLTHLILIKTSKPLFQPQPQPQPAESLNLARTFPTAITLTLQDNTDRSLIK